LTSETPGPQPIRIAVDAMGGDHGPDEIVPGAIAHAEAHPEDVVLLVGDEARLRAIVPVTPPNVTIVPASQVIEMDEHPAKALREKKDASILVACDLVRNGLADAIVTAGHTGAGMAAAILRIDRRLRSRWSGRGCPSCSSTSAPTRTRRPRT
jgi:phosphate acyltransferase